MTKPKLPPISTNFRTGTVVPITESNHPTVDPSQNIQQNTNELQLDTEDQLNAVDTYEQIKVVKIHDKHHSHLQITNNTGGLMDISPSPLSPVSTQSEHTPVVPSVHIPVNDKEITELVELIGTKSYAKQAVKEFLTMLSQFYAVMVGALLTIFTSQQCCNDIVDTTNGTVLFSAPHGQCTTDTLLTAHECSTTEQVTDLDNLNIAALAFNFITLGVMLIYFALIWEREQYILKNFLEDPLKSEVNVRTQWGKFPELAYYMNQRSRNAYVACCIGAVVQCINCIISAVSIFVYYYGGKATAIAFLSNLLVQGGFVFKAAEIAHVDWKHHLTRTILADVPVSYNKVNTKLHKQA